MNKADRKFKKRMRRRAENNRIWMKRCKDQHNRHMEKARWANLKVEVFDWKAHADRMVERAGGEIKPLERTRKMPWE